MICHSPVLVHALGPLCSCTMLSFVLFDARSVFVVFVVFDVLAATFIAVNSISQWAFRPAQCLPAVFAVASSAFRFPAVGQLTFVWNHIADNQSSTMTLFDRSYEYTTSCFVVTTVYWLASLHVGSLGVIFF